MNPTYLSKDPLAMKSVELILKGQAASGSYIASPTFPQYNYAWLRDGSFCALAMHLSGEVESAHRFNTWVGTTVEKYQDLFIDGVRILRIGGAIPPEKSPPTRFHLDGSVENDHHEVWPNYQLDGYGTWLAVLNQIESTFSDSILNAVKIVADFLMVAWPHPCFDCWEEGDDKIHGSTLLAVAGGLKAAAEITRDSRYLVEYKNIVRRIESDFVIDGHFVKNSGNSRVDAGLAWAALPHRAYESNHPLVLGTLEAIKSQLQSTPGGVKRYLGDTYYGGGDWVLLEGLLAWNEAAIGDRSFWESSGKWFNSVADSQFLLPEQVLENVQEPKMIARWEEQWGKVAHPLLWSHAMYLLMLHEGAQNKWI